jgi:tetratricopeptide (TPR) repeat protein
VKNTAENAQDSKQLLLKEGWTELELVMEELMTTVKELAEGPDEWKEQVTVEDEVRLLEGKEPGFWTAFGRALVEKKWTIALLSALLAWGIYRDRPWIWILAGISLGFVVFLFPALHLYFGQPLQYYNRLNKAKVWARWDEVEYCIKQLRRVTVSTMIGPGEMELLRCEAQVFASRGKVEEGLRLFRKVAFDPKVPEWMYLSFIAGIYDVAKDFENSLKCRQQAAELNPDTATVWIDLAYGLVRGLNRPAEARKALAAAEKLEVNALGKPYLAFLRGVIAWRENQSREALPHLEEALKGLNQFAHVPLAEGMVLLTKSYLCAVLGPLGETQKAQTYWDETELFLKANKEDELLAACRAALTIPGQIDPVHG